MECKGLIKVAFCLDGRWREKIKIPAYLIRLRELGLKRTSAATAIDGSSILMRSNRFNGAPRERSRCFALLLEIKELVSVSSATKGKGGGGLYYNEKHKILR